jgi:thiosulfate/3-mercaptopyruvate sulfurtransferase
MFTDLISTTELVKHLNEPDWAILDCRYTLTDPERGRQDYQISHIPGAVYAHLEEDLSGPIIKGVTGRHPLPSPESAAAKFSEWGIDDRVQVIVYDDAGGALAAGRAWWMLRWLGHQGVAVLDGGWKAWQTAAFTVRPEVDMRLARQFIPRPDPSLLVTTADVEKLCLDPNYHLFDARTEERYHGQNETIDPIAGHIPGALSIPYPANLKPDGTFRDREALRRRYERFLGIIPPERTIFYCGSGVTSIHNILAMEYAGLGLAKLYVGSWSEWIANGKRPVEK